MEAVNTDTLNARADLLASEARSLYNAARRIKQQSAALRDEARTLQTEEVKSGSN